MGVTVGECPSGRERPVPFVPLHSELCLELLAVLRANLPIRHLPGLVPSIYTIQFTCHKMFVQDDKDHVRLREAERNAAGTVAARVISNW